MNITIITKDPLSIRGITGITSQSRTRCWYTSASITAYTKKGHECYDSLSRGRNHFVCRHSYSSVKKNSYYTRATTRSLNRIITYGCISYTKKDCLAKIKREILKVQNEYL